MALSSLGTGLPQSKTLPRQAIALTPRRMLPVPLADRQRWRANFAYLPGRVLIEIEGGIWVQGRHNRAAGFNADLEKYLEAGLLGWRLFRFGPDQITMENVERLVTTIACSACDRV